MFKRQSASSRDGPRKAAGASARRKPGNGVGDSRAGEEAGLDGPKDPQAPRPEDKASAAKPPRKKKKRLGPLPRFLIKLAVVAAATLVVFTFVLGVHIHHGNRMYPFVLDGDLLITYKLDPYHTGDVVVYRNPVTGELAVSRLIAQGEKEIVITQQGQLLSDGYNPWDTVLYPTWELDGSEIRFPYRMSADGVFLLDDYREIGLDSRAFGQVRESELQGKVVYVFRRRGI